jgi:hypothetical protein
MGAVLFEIGGNLPELDGHTGSCLNDCGDVEPLNAASKRMILLFESNKYA